MSDLSDVKAGDVLAYQNAWDGAGLTTVDRVTKTLIVCGAGRFRLENGYAAGRSDYSRSRVWRPTPEDLIKVRIQRAQRGVKALEVDKSNVDAVEALLAAVKPARGR